jgi:hypothetical protein
MDVLIEKYGKKINRALDFLGKRFSYKVKIYPPEGEDSIYGDEDTRRSWGKVPDFDGRYVVTGVMNNISPSAEILDPFYEEERRIYFSEGEEPIKDSLVEVLMPEGDIMRFRLGAEDLAVGAIYRRFVLYPVA